MGQSRTVSKPLYRRCSWTPAWGYHDSTFLLAGAGMCILFRFSSDRVSCINASAACELQIAATRITDAFVAESQAFGMVWQQRARSHPGVYATKLCGICETLAVMCWHPSDVCLQHNATDTQTCSTPYDKLEEHVK